VRAPIAQRLQQQPPNSFLVGNAMLRQDDRSEGLFKQNPVGRPYPADHPLRMSRQLVDAALAELSRAFAKLYARDGRPSIPPERLLRGLLLAGVGRSMRALWRLADVAGFWTLDRTTIPGRSAVILRQHTTPFRPMIVPFDDLELVYQSLRNSSRHIRANFRASMRRTPNWAPFNLET
jgi:hypothetical protein